MTRRFPKVTAASVLLGMALTAGVGFAATQVSSLVPHVFSAGTPIKASEINANFAAVAQGVQDAKANGLPTQSGKAGAYLKTDGISASWSVAPGPNVELQVVNNVGQNIPSLLGSTTFDTLRFSGGNNPQASLTGGNTWNGTLFRVGAGGAGWYEIDAQVVGVAATSGTVSAIGVGFYLDKNATNAPATAQYRSTYDSSPSAAVFKNHSTVHAYLYLAPGDTVEFRGQSWSNSTAANISADGSTSLTIIKIK
ncbi:MAG: hypothetical protein ACK4GP_15690 [Deinococcus sp.]